MYINQKNIMDIYYRTYTIEHYSADRSKQLDALSATWIAIKKPVLNEKSKNIIFTCKL